MQCIVVTDPSIPCLPPVLIHLPFSLQFPSLSSIFINFWAFDAMHFGQLHPPHCSPWLLPNIPSLPYLLNFVFPFLAPSPRRPICVAHLLLSVRPPTGIWLRKLALPPREATNCLQLLRGGSSWTPSNSFLECWLVCEFMSATLLSCCHVQKMLFCFSLPWPLALTAFLLLPVWWSLTLGDGIDVPLIAERSTDTLTRCAFLN